MPMPVSRTSMRNPSGAVRRTATEPPAGVNFTALETTFQITCCRRSGSPDVTAGRARTSVVTVMRFADAAVYTTDYERIVPAAPPRGR